MKTTLTLLTALLLLPLAALPAANRGTFVREPHVVIKHGVHDGRYFIGPGMFVIEDGSVLMSAPWGRPPANVFEGIVNKHPVPMLYRSTDAGETWQELGRPEVKWRHSGFVSDGNGGKPSLQIVYPNAAFLKEGILLFHSRDVTKNTFKTTRGMTFVSTEAQRALTGGVTCLLA